MISARSIAHGDGNSVRRAGLLAVLFLAELICLAAAYQFLVQIECRQTNAMGVCEALKSLVARAIVIFAVGGVLLSARPAARSRFLGEAVLQGWCWPALHGAGLALMCVPFVIAAGGGLLAAFGIALWLWGLGAVAAILGGLFWLAPPVAWRQLARDLGSLGAGVLLVAALIPDVAEAVRPIWDWSVLTLLTFRAVAVFLQAFADVSVADPASYVIGIQGFAVHISRQCSGVEGLALVTAFVGIYAVIFRQNLRLWRFLLVVLPLALLASWLLNVVRIGVLILLGAFVSPDLAVNGFHSYAGWLFFTLLALGLVAAVQQVRWLHRAAAGNPPMPLRRDPLAAMILPFVLFMLISTLVSALAPHPELGYPVKALTLSLVLLAFVPAYRALKWRLDPLSLGVGLVVGVVWLMTARAGDAGLAALLASMTKASLISWIALRLLGTAVLVPLVEEMFFRGYLLTRLDGPGWPRRVLAIAVSATAFAAMHGRWIEAFAAGVLFAMLALRQGRVTDAVQAHIAANALIGAVAVIRGDFGLI